MEVASTVNAEEKSVNISTKSNLETSACSVDQVKPDDGLGGDNVKENHPVSNSPECIASKVLKQTEFYFSDANILKDSFLLNKVKSSQDGFIKLSIIENFKKISSLTKDHDLIVAALQNSTEVEVSENGDMIRRRKPLPEWDSSVYFRSLIISNIGSSSGVINTTILDNIFKKVGITTLLVRIISPSKRLPRDLKSSQMFHTQLGSEMCAVVEFEDNEAAEAAKSVAKESFPKAYVEILGVNQRRKKLPTFPKQKKPAVTTKKHLDGAGAGSTDSILPSEFSLSRFRSAMTAINNAAKMELIRQPRAPPDESATGFEPGWRHCLAMERLGISVGNSCAEKNSAICPEASYLLDPAIVSASITTTAQPLLPLSCPPPSTPNLPTKTNITTNTTSASASSAAKWVKPLDPSALPFIPTDKALASVCMDT